MCRNKVIKDDPMIKAPGLFQTVSLDAYNLLLRGVVPMIGVDPGVVLPLIGPVGLSSNLPG